MKIEILKKLNIEMPGELSDFINSGHDELSDYCHEYSDGCEDVIYYYKAESLFNQASTEERDEAERTNEDCGGFPEGCNMAQRFTILAYWIVRSRIEAAIRAQAEEAADELRELIIEAEEIADTLEDLA